MFKKDIAPGPKTKLKSSAQRSIRAKFVATFPLLAPYIDDIIPKKSQLDTIKIPDARATLYALSSAPLFYQHMDDALVPHLALVHRYPDFWPRVRVDRGAIRFVLGGAALMVPGMTSPGGRLPEGRVPEAPTAAPTAENAEEEAETKVEDGAAPGVPAATGTTPADDERYYAQPELEVGTVVVVEAEGKETACCVGVLKMGTKEMKSAKKGIGMEGAHYLGDGLWRMKID